MISDVLSALRGEMGFLDVIVGLMASLTVIFFVTPFHEFAHAFIADKLGDPTARRMGRLTLNPLAHMDMVGAALIVFCGFGWAKPVPVQAYNLKNPKTDMALIGAAGPISNLLAAFLGGFILNAVIKFFAYNVFIEYVVLFLVYYIQLNIVLAVFNLIPIPPLDGSRILSVFLPDSIFEKLHELERYIFIAVILLSFTGIFSKIINMPVNFLYNSVIRLTGLPFGIGW